MSPPAPRVIIAGAGIAGPILAIFLKQNGYSPVIYERQPKGAESGIALALQPNGLRVLAMIPGLLKKIDYGSRVNNFQFYSVLEQDPGLLANSTIIQDMLNQGQMEFPWWTTPRPAFHATLVAEAEAYGIPIIWDRCVVAVQENPNETVTVMFHDGSRDTASFVVGCDGLHSNVRTALFGKEKARYTGMTQFGGHSPIPADKTLCNGMTNIFGDGIHFISYPTSVDTIGWVITTHEPENKETWKPMDKAGQDEVRAGVYANLPYGAGDCVRTCRQITKYGLYDRAELPTWYKGRVILIGDAAHPTSPHLGQGANQAFEDIYHLVRLLTKYNPCPESMPSPLSPSSAVLHKAFDAFIAVRIPRASALVAGARAQGELRLVHGVEACLARNEMIRKVWGSEQGAMIQGYMTVWTGGFDDALTRGGEQELLQRMSIHK